MTREVISVSPETPLRDVAALLAEHRISGVPVIADGTCVGIVSEGDLLPKQLGSAPRRRAPLEWLIGERTDPEELRRRAASTAAQSMSAPPVTTDEEMSLYHAARLMIDRDVNRLPVLREGRVVGIISRADLVRAYLRLDEDIVRALRENVLRRTMWLDPDTFTVEVHDGKVRMAGTADRRSTAGIIGRLAGLVDGVVEVRNDIGWEFDDTSLPASSEPDHEPGAASILAREPHAPLHR
jgi:CBS domain-containing protein